LRLKAKSGKNKGGDRGEMTEFTVHQYLYKERKQHGREKGQHSREEGLKVKHGRRQNNGGKSPPVRGLCAVEIGVF